MDRPACKAQDCLKPRESSGKGKYRSMCAYHNYWKNPEKARAKNRAKRLRHPEYKVRERISRHKLQMRRYGITDKDIEELLEKQKHKCAICFKDGILLQLDHDHKTGKIRGFLCGGCNIGLGGFKDNVRSLGRAVMYLEG